MTNKLTLSSAYLLATFTVVFILIFSALSVYKIINEQKSYAEIINIAGKQRMLSQKILANALITGHYPSAELDKDITLLTKEMHIAEDKIESRLADDDLYDISNADIDELIELAHKFIRGPTPELRKNLIEKRENFLQELDRVVKKLESKSNDLSRKMITYGSAFLIIILTIIFSVTVFLFKPLYKKFIQNQEKLAKVTEVLKASNNNLERQVLERTIELEQSIMLIEKEGQIKTDFLANMSHELRTPMNAILGYSGLLNKTELNDKQKNYNLKVLKSSNALMGLIQDILDFSQIDQGSLTADSIKFNFGKILNTFSEEYSEKALEKDIKLSVKGKSQVPTELVGDPDQLVRILSKITDNAIKFNKPGGTVRIEITIEDTNENQIALQFNVVDTGIGMKADQIDSLFQSFTQADSSRTRKHGGVGLGLAITKEMVDSMSGKIWIESEYEVGTTVHIRLPFEVA